MSAVFDAAACNGRTLWDGGKFGQPEMVCTGLKALDDHPLRLGLRRGDLSVLAGRPSMGTSALALQMALHAALDEGLPTIYFSMSMGLSDMAIRMISHVARVDFIKTRAASLDDEERHRCALAEETLRSSPLLIDDSPALSAKAIRHRISDICVSRRYRDGKSIGLVVIDDLQSMLLISGSRGADKACRKMLPALRETAHEFEVPILLLSGLSRRIEKRQDKHPSVDDLPAASLAAYADQVILLYREGYYRPDRDVPDRDSATLIISRRRSRIAASVSLRFVHEHLRYEDWPAPCSRY